MTGLDTATVFMAVACGWFLGWFFATHPDEVDFEDGGDFPLYGWDGDTGDWTDE